MFRDDIIDAWMMQQYCWSWRFLTVRFKATWWVPVQTKTRSGTSEIAEVNAGRSEQVQDSRGRFVIEEDLNVWIEDFMCATV
jgi:hypothetical protein